MAEMVRASLGLPQKSVDDVKQIAEQQGVSMAEVIRRAIATEKYLLDARARGGRILIKEAGNDQMVEVLFR